MLKPAIKQAPTARRKQASGGRDRGGGMEGFSSGPSSGDYINVKKIAKCSEKFKTMLILSRLHSSRDCSFVLCSRYQTH